MAVRIVTETCWPQAKWRARIVETTNWRGKPRWRAMFDRYFAGSWDNGIKWSCKLRTEADAESYANDILDHMSAPPRGTYVGRTPDEWKES